MAWTLCGSLYLSMLVPLVPRCAQLLPCHALLPTSACGAPGSPTAPVHTKASSLCRGLGSSSGMLPSGQSSARRCSCIPHVRLLHAAMSPASHSLAQPTAAEQPGGRDMPSGRIIFKKQKGLVALLIRATGSVCHELKRRGKLFIRRYIPGQEDAITQATVSFVSSNTSEASYSRAFPIGQANTERTFVNVHGLVACEH